ncbi:FAD-binding and (Fe-S)-binding domain-containing protein [Maribellus maritimus]|uniref:FAD-binding and (Fe-S)-binding domain-containing protein n=1 Tax=Maribellus maritimus TaxID=2870838 RepID=UPI001EEC5C4E|nr:FAD-binding and (Fe-S)-binding domain-containing protein [Maribellus maritimus]MCG6189762.1 FAD-binding protein [Maribellus maritimus]
MQPDFNQLKSQLDGDLFFDNVQRVLYSTDASQYKEMPLAVTRPKNKEDIKKIIAFARENGTSVIPRGAGTSLAGQVVGSGIVVDMSKYMNKIIEFNEEKKYVIVQPGVVLAELNLVLSKYGMQFGPETSTANRCVIGGMLGNNSCGLHSLVYGSVREHILEVDAILSDGSETTFKSLTKKEFQQKLNGNPNKLEKAIYQNINEILSNEENQKEIRDKFPDPKLTRRNMGYAIDVLLDSEIYTKGGTPFNFCKLLAGSEGTLAFSTQIKLNVIPLPPKFKGLVCAHFASLEESLQGNLIALKHNPTAIELMDDTVMQAAKENIEQRKNRFFVKGDPAAMLMIEFSFETEQELTDTATALEKDFREAGLGYHFPLVTGADKIKRVWSLRTAGLGLLANIPGDRKGVPGIEDTAVAPEYLPDYVADIKKVLAKLGLSSVYYAHIATGEIHFRPLINFKEKGDVELFDTLMTEVAKLVKKYRGSMSGEHGDGRARGKFIPFMLGDKNYELVKEVKKAWDPDNILNPGKIVDTPPITENLRVITGKETPEYNTVFDFSNYRGYFRSIEKCNGTGDCRKSEVIGGTMCPTFMATRDEDKSTRGRANILREFLYNNHKEKAFDHKEIYDILDLCISCKACKSECPSNVDMAKLKAEFMQQYYDIHGVSMRSRLIAYLPRLYQLAVVFRSLSNLVTNTTVFKKTVGFAPERSIPKLSKIPLSRWVQNGIPSTENQNKGTVYLFNDEFTNYNESDIGIKAILLLTKLGYDIKIPVHKESGRTFLSKGLIRTSKKIATENVSLLKDIISEATPLIGIEPSAILAFRDEYPELVDSELQTAAKKLGDNALLFEEFIAKEMEKGNISASDFTNEEKYILLHGHCQQKAVASTEPTKVMLSLPPNYSVKEIPSGCCGMAGSFGYEKEHYELSQKIGEMVLFPTVREADEETIISAPGTSCRHQIKDGTGKMAKHPVEVLYEALRK